MIFYWLNLMANGMDNYEARDAIFSNIKAIMPLESPLCLLAYHQELVDD